MKVYTQSVNFSANESLLTYVEEKLNKLDTFYDQIVAARVFLKLDNDRTVAKIVEVRLEVPGDDIMVTKEAEDFPEAVDMAYNTLKRLVIKKKETSKQF